MKQSVIYQDILEEGRAEGLALGKAEGIAKGKAEGIAKGKAEGIAKGKAESVALILERRFGRVPQALRNRLLAIQNTRRLEQCLGMALGVSSLAEFQRRAPKPAAKGRKKPAGRS